MKYRVRFNKSRGQPGRGTKDHVWRVFDETGKEWIVKHVYFTCDTFGEKEEKSEDWNIATPDTSRMVIDREKSVAYFSKEIA